MAAAMSMMSEAAFDAKELAQDFSRSNKPRLKSGTYANTVLTKRQLRQRAKNKRAKIARRINRD